MTSLPCKYVYIFHFNHIHFCEISDVDESLYVKTEIVYQKNSIINENIHITLYKFFISMISHATLSSLWYMDQSYRLLNENYSWNDKNTLKFSKTWNVEKMILTPAEGLKK